MKRTCQTAAALLMMSSLIGCGGSGGDPADNGPAGSPPKVASTPNLPTRDGKTPVDYKYRLMFVSQCSVGVPGGDSSDMDGEMEFLYTWRWHANEAELLLHQMDVSTDAGGQRFTMSRSRFYLQQGEETIDDSYENVNPEVKQVLDSAFETPLCKVAVDDSGRQVEQTVVAKPEAKMVLDNGIVVNARLFHAPFLADQAQWEAPAGISMGNATDARGTLLYRPTGKPVAGDEASDFVEVEVSGTLVGDEKPEPGQVENVVYKVQGVQTYSKRLRDWVSGKLDVAVSFDTPLMDQKVTTTGTLTVSLELLSSETVAAEPDADVPAATASQDDAA